MRNDKTRHSKRGINMIEVRETEDGEIIYDSLMGVYGAKGKDGFKWFMWEVEARDYLQGYLIGKEI